MAYLVESFWNDFILSVFKDTWAGGHRGYVTTGYMCANSFTANSENAPDCDVPQGPFNNLLLEAWPGPH